MKRNRSKKIILLLFSLSVFLSVMFGTWFIRSVRAELGCVTITVQYKDGYPRSDARVLWRNTTVWEPFGVTNESGIAIRYDYLAPGVYQASAWYPNLGTQFGDDTPFTVNATGDGSATIQEDYNSIEIHSPANDTYTTNTIPLNFTFHNSSVISWIGYSLDDQSNVTISGNTIITGLANGLHKIMVYANDTNSYMAYSDVVYFTVQAQPVGGIYVPVNKLELLAPYVGLTILLAVALVTVVYVKKKH